MVTVEVNQLWRHRPDRGWPNPARHPTVRVMAIGGRIAVIRDVDTGADRGIKTSHLRCDYDLVATW